MDLTTAIWRKSTRSNSTGGNCVEVAVVRGSDAGIANKAAEEFVVLVRDTKNRDRETQVFTIAEWDAFLAGVRDGQFDSATMISDLTSQFVS
ncbi:DUF397 domain-containing protein [Spongiactinospora sp. TRM90649]|uniref:DUF397 domain-containing protein n=1 Tax=Spongiactinospora sp. TRM90649 TaxID=3031114 RepID=UPI0023F89ED6|nr:DUF397 domain-containing protein [Spongiactinospora sp. TRM90649]MDF5751278.1 DUF397 domain-containing protein [Spongiactinospora sp. TRM90649]